MSLWLLIPFLGLAAIAQIAWLPLVPIFGYKVDLVLILVVSWGLLGPAGQAAQWGFIAGLVLDLASGLPFGVHTITLAVIGLLTGWGQATFFRGNIVAPPAAIVVATLLYDILILAILSLLGWQINWQDRLLVIILPTAILNTVIAPFVYLPLQFLQHRLYPQMEF